MNISRIKMADLHLAEKNVRIHSARQIDEFVRSIQMFGQIRPIVCDENYEILAGNGLYTALLQLGAEEADCYVVTGLSENEKKKLMLADNKIFSLGVDNLKAFDEIILELGNDFDIPGYEPDLIETLVFDLSDADDYMSGYGIVSDNSKEQMQKAAERFRDDEAKFEQFNSGGIPQNSFRATETLQTSAQPARYVGVAEEEKPQKESQNELQQRYIICPKCGEKIWL